MSNLLPTSTTTSARSVPARRKWFVDLKMGKQERSAAATASASNETALTTTTAALAANNNPMKLPVGYSDQRLSDLLTHEDDDRLLARRSWDIALQPIKQLPMNMILAWMAGNTFSLMSIMIVVMLFMKPIQVNLLFFRIHFSFIFFSQYLLLVQHLHH
jgi:hypothetical protein